jgi:hypothetical protein
MTVRFIPIGTQALYQEIHQFYTNMDARFLPINIPALYQKIP